MKILFYSVKGGQGKTTHALSYAKHRDYLYLTNDFESGTIEIYQEAFAENQLQAIRKEDELDLPADLDIVFDFGGWVDERVEQVAKICDVIVVPIFFQSRADLVPCLKGVSSLKKLNKNVVILINNTEKKLIEFIQTGLSREFPDLEIFTFNRSKFIHKLADDGKTIDRLSKESGLNKYMLKEIIEQKDQFYKYLDKF